jgi:hypothetical protein
MADVIGGSISGEGPSVTGGSIGSGSGTSGPVVPTVPVDVTSFTFSQPTPAASWLITHNLNGFPSVTTTDLAGNVIVGQVQYLNANTVLVVFSTPVAGVAYLNM